MIFVTTLALASMAAAAPAEVATPPVNATPSLYDNATFKVMGPVTITSENRCMMRFNDTEFGQILLGFSTDQGECDTTDPSQVWYLVQSPGSGEENRKNMTRDSVSDLVFPNSEFGLVSAAYVKDMTSTNGIDLIDNAFAMTAFGTGDCEEETTIEERWWYPEVHDPLSSSGHRAPEGSKPLDSDHIINNITDIPNMKMCRPAIHHGFTQYPAWNIVDKYLNVLDADRLNQLLPNQMAVDMYFVKAYKFDNTIKGIFRFEDNTARIGNNTDLSNFTITSLDNYQVVSKNISEYDQ